MNKNELKELISKMTLEEKASMCSGSDFWHTDAVERLNIPSVMVSDGPHGLRKQDLESDHLGVNESIKAVCFPSSCASAASFNRKLIRHVGEILGNECQAENVSVILGPGANIKRSPLCGRNFEYFSEDPYVASEMAGAFIDGVQSKNVGTSLKHFLANNQEHRRMSSSSQIDERTLREIYMSAFEGAVKNHKPWTVMCSYNRLNGEYVAGSRKFLNDVLRDEWGFDGCVVSDWGAVNDRIPDLLAGLDLEMPASGESNTKEIIEAVKNGSLDEAEIDKACFRILSFVYKFLETHDKNAVFDRDKDHADAELAARETMVLLKNDGILPLKKGTNIAVIGEFAKKPRFQGGGSSHINCSKVTSAWEILKDEPKISYAKGYNTDSDTVDGALIDEAVNIAKNADTAVIFAGLPDIYESEGYDRKHMRMPESHNKLIEAVCSVQPNTVVVLHNGSPVEMPWIDNVKAVLESYLSGQGVGKAQVEILYGDVNPSGKLAETFPKKLSDNPSYLYFRGEGDKVEYREGVFVGYRYYDKKEMDVLFPFGHGLSYTTFKYDNLKLNKNKIKDTDGLTVSADITNTGSMKGKEIVQLYVGAPDNGEIIRPVKELRGFEKVELEPGETKTVSFKLSKRAFAYWNTKLHDWHVESGNYKILLAASSRDIRLSAEVQVECTQVIKPVYTLDTTIGDILKNPKAGPILSDLMRASNKSFDAGSDDDSGHESAINKDMESAMFEYMPLHAAMSFGGLSKDVLKDILNKINSI